MSEPEATEVKASPDSPFPAWQLEFEPDRMLLYQRQELSLAPVPQSLLPEMYDMRREIMEGVEPLDLSPEKMARFGRLVKRTLNHATGAVLLKEKARLAKGSPAELDYTEMASIYTSRVRGVMDTLRALGFDGQVDRLSEIYERIPEEMQKMTEIPIDPEMHAILSSPGQNSQKHQ